MRKNIKNAMKRSKKRNKQRANEKNTPNEEIKELKHFWPFFVSLAVVGLYFLFQRLFYSNISQKGMLYLSPTGFSTCACIIGIALFLISLFYSIINYIRDTYKKLFVVLNVVCCVLIVFPFAFLGKYMYADRSGIKYTNMFGKTVKQYQYSDISKCEIGASSGSYRVSSGGVWYKLSFKDGKELMLEQPYLQYPCFKNSKNMVEFNKAVDKYCTPIYDDSDSAMERRYFDSDEDYNYFINYVSKLKK